MVEKEQDARWRFISGHPWRCSGCDESHQGVFDLVAARPDAWQGDAQVFPNDAIKAATDVLTQDFCVIGGEHFFVRCRLALPRVGDLGEDFGFGVWSTLSQANFWRYAASFRGEPIEGPLFGYLANALRGYPDTLYMPCNLWPQPDAQRPSLLVKPSDHPLARDQADGVTFDRLIEIYAANGHRLLSALN